MTLTIKLVRHGQSRANVREVEARDVGDHNIELTDHGKEQARTVGSTLGADYLKDALVYCSPYTRTRQTLECILEGAGLGREHVRIYEDPRLREVDPGYSEYEKQHELRRTHGWFYYRFKGGESPADCFDRTSSFLESLMRQIERKAAEHVLIVTHGLTIRCFAMRYLHLSVEQFDELANPGNCDVITIGDKHELPGAGWITGRWGLVGLRKRGPDEQ
ncbi:MAG: histidine phosphatase family protein [Archangium sp.]|nr:histidine phosphatase family protein [Archangium sp.]